MPIELTFYGHATFRVSDGTHAVLIDPYFTGNPAAEEAGIGADDVDCTHMAISHGHFDHFQDAPSIAKRTGCGVYSSFEICEYLNSEHGIELVEPGGPGGTIPTEFGSITYTQAVHSSSWQGRQMGVAMGLVIEMGDQRVYYAGDTALFRDMKLIGELYTPTVSLLPVGDRFTMGPAHAKIAAEWVGAKLAVPFHYGTWEKLVTDISAFAPAGVDVHEMRAGETLSLGEVIHAG